jgi:hypothetical protein
MRSRGLLSTVGEAPAEVVAHIHRDLCVRRPLRSWEGYSRLWLARSAAVMEG